MSFAMENIYSVAKPFCLLLKLLGLFPLSFSGGNLKYRWFDFIAFLGPLIVSIVLVILNILTDEVALGTSKILLKAWNILLIFCLICITVLIFYQQCKRHSIMRFFSIIQEFDRKAERLGMKVDFRQQKKRIALVASSFIGACMLNYILTPLMVFEYFNQTGRIESVMMMSYCYLLVMTTALQLQFTFVALALRDRFVLINNFLR